MNWQSRVTRRQPTDYRRQSAWVAQVSLHDKRQHREDDGHAHHVQERREKQEQGRDRRLAPPLVLSMRLSWNLLYSCDAPVLLHCGSQLTAV